MEPILLKIVLFDKVPHNLSLFLDYSSICQAARCVRKVMGLVSSTNYTISPTA